MHAALGLTGEAGEFADCVKKHLVYGKELDKWNAREELGDLLWFVALAATTLGIDLSEVADENIAKLKLRYPESYSDELAGARLDKEVGHA
jgi:NTP pyrophosphatase (non-canonical NTP hydrolase)